MKTFWQHNEETECVWHTWSWALKSVICRNTMSISTRASFVYSSPDVCWLEYKSDKNFSSEFGGLGLCSNIRTGSSANGNATRAMATGIFTVRNEVAEVIFSQASVCPRGGVSAPGGICSWGGGVCSGGCIPARTEADTPPGQNSWHTLVKILPCRNFVADGKNGTYFESTRDCCEHNSGDQSLVKASLISFPGHYLPINAKKRN